MDKERIKYLYNQHLEKVLSSSELSELRIFAADSAFDEIFQDLTDGLWNLDESTSPGMDPVRANFMYEYIVLQPQPKMTVRLWPRIVSIAAAVVVVVSGLYLFNYNSNRIDRVEKNAYMNDVPPGKVGATLTLDNGKKISLIDAQNGEIGEENGISIKKTADGQVVYEIKGNVGSSNKTNTLTTAKGETYTLTLPDKSKVWMNAASSLTYSAASNEGGQRKVKLSGEAYFEITKDKAHPFIVETEKQTVKVLGTHFNVSSYFDEPSTKTTLLEGSVQINNGTILKPGEQANVLIGKKINIAVVDVDKVIAWKNGRFMFENERIESIMRKLARWYNIEVIYKDDVQDIPFTAFISKYDDISKILDKITYTQNIHFKIEGRRVTVMK